MADFIDFLADYVPKGESMASTMGDLIRENVRQRLFCEEVNETAWTQGERIARVDNY